MKSCAVLALLKRPFGRNSIRSFSGQLLPADVCSRSAGGFRAVCSHQGGSYVCGSLMYSLSRVSLFPSLKTTGPCHPLPAAAVQCWREARFYHYCSFDADGHFSAFGASQLSGSESQAEAQQKPTSQSRQGDTNPRLDLNPILLTWWQAC